MPGTIRFAMSLAKTATISKEFGVHLADRHQHGARRHHVAAADADFLDLASDRGLHCRPDGDLRLQAAPFGLQPVDLLLLLALGVGQHVALLLGLRFDLDDARGGIGDVLHGLVVHGAGIGDLEPADQPPLEQRLVARQDLLELLGAHLAGRDLLLGG